MSQIHHGATGPAGYDRRRQTPVVPALPLAQPYGPPPVYPHHHHHPPPPPQVYAPPFYPQNPIPYHMPHQQHPPPMMHPMSPAYPLVMMSPTPVPEPVPEPLREPPPGPVAELPVEPSFDTPMEPVTEPVVEPVRSYFKPPLPWYSDPDSPFPRRVRRKKRAAPAAPPKVAKEETVIKTEASPASEEPTPATSKPPSEADTTRPTTPSSTRPPSIAATNAQKPTPSVPSTPPAAAPVTPKKAEVNGVEKTVENPKDEQKPREDEKPQVEATQKAVEEPKAVEAVPAQDKAQAEIETPKPEEKPVEKPGEKPVEKKPAAPKAWADLLRKNDTKAAAAAATPKAPARANGVYASLEEALNDFRITGAVQAPFLEPRGLVNTGNMCFMNGILQMLVFCGPFYHFIDKISTAAKNFKNDTPLIETMIMFMREFRVMHKDPKVHIKTDDLEKFGEPFAPEHVYDTIMKLKRFSHMRRGHQHDAEEFLGFLLDGLHEEAVETMKKSAVAITNGNSNDESGWMEVGHKQKAATTRTTEVVESPITKIFGGKLRSEFRVPGLTPSVTLEPYTPLQLDIQAPDVNSVSDALKHITKPEKIQGDFKSPKGPNVTATKQVYIDSVPPVLILHLKRFQYDNTGGAQKIWKQIAYPLELDFPAEAMSPNRRQAPKPKYRLIGVVYHHGTSTSGGHYTVDVLRQDAKSWIRMDDTSIKRVAAQDVIVDLKDVLRQNAQDDHANGWEEVNRNGEVNGTPKPVSRKYIGKDNKVAYILFYQRI